jgi:DNA-binding CsgD family transcriptional regulator/PAS domain-containing protein
MGQQDRQLLTAIDQLYAASIGDVPWHHALQSVVRIFGGAGGSLFELDRRRGEIVHWIGEGLESGEDEYVARMNAINPRMHYSLAHPPGHIAWDHKILSEEELRRHEFYAWMEKTVGVQYFMGSRLHDEGTRTLFTSVDFTRKQGHVSEDHLRAYRVLTGHISNAWQLSQRLARAEAERDMLRHANDMLPWGVVALDRDGKIISSNETAQRIFSRNDGLTTDQNELHAVRSSDNLTLNQHIGGALACARHETVSGGSAMTIARRPPAPELVVQIVPFARLPKNACDRLPAVIVFISDPADGLAAKPEKLAAVFGLSPREAELAALLCQDIKLKQAADRMAITNNTARNHLRGIFVKTGINSQSALMRLFMSLLLR